MAIKPKEKVVQFRVETDLFLEYEKLCHDFGHTVSSALRNSMANTLNTHAQQVLRSKLREKK